MPKSHVSLEASALNAVEDDWLEATLTIERDDEPDEELRYQDVTMTKAEMSYVYERMKMKLEQRAWSFGTVER